MPSVGARAGVQSAQLNGKQKGRCRMRQRPNLRCPRNGTADEVAPAASSLAHMPLKTQVFGKVARAAPSARIPANGGWRAGQRRRTPSRPRGTGSGLFAVGTLMSHRWSPVLRAAVAAPSSFASFASLVFLLLLPARGVAQAPALGLLPVVVTGTREPTPLDRIVGDVVVIDAERIRASSAIDRGSAASRRRHPAVAQRRAGQSSVAAASRRAARWCWSTACGSWRDAWTGRLRRHRLAQISASRSCAAQVESLWRRCGGRVIQIITRRGGPPHLSGHAAVGELR